MRDRMESSLEEVVEWGEVDGIRGAIRGCLEDGKTAGVWGGIHACTLPNNMVCMMIIIVGKKFILLPSGW
jgi:hypothetical protein